MKRITTASVPRCRYTFTRNRPIPAAEYEVSYSLSSSSLASTSSFVMTMSRDGLAVLGRDLLGAKVDDLAADARARRLADLDVDVARLARDGLGEQREEELLVGERAGQGRFRVSRALDDADVRQVAVPLREVEPVADDEAVLDGEAEVVDVDLDLARAPACGGASTPSRSRARACGRDPSSARS